VELARAQALVQALGPQACVWPHESLADVTRRMAACAGVVGVDSGLSHIAVALGLPHVQIFSQDRVWRAGPVGAAHQIAVGGTFTPDVSAVLQAWEAAWAARPEQAA
jgi:heptosyltransferase-1